MGSFASHRVAGIFGYLIDTQSPSGWPQCIAKVQFTGSATSAPNPFILQPSSFILSATYTYGPQGPISQWTATQGEHHFPLDAHGNVRALTDATGIAPFPALHHHRFELLG